MADGDDLRAHIPRLRRYAHALIRPADEGALGWRRTVAASALPRAARPERVLRL